MKSNNKSQNKARQNVYEMMTIIGNSRQPQQQTAINKVCNAETTKVKLLCKYQIANEQL